VGEHLALERGEDPLAHFRGDVDAAKVDERVQRVEKQQDQDEGRQSAGAAAGDHLIEEVLSAKRQHQPGHRLDE